MKRSGLRVQAVVLVGWCLTAAAAFFDPVAAEDVQPFSIRPAVPLAGADRTYWVGSGATDEEALALRDALVAAGARHVNLFVPDMVVVCDVPPAVAMEVARVASTTAFRSYSDRAVRASSSAGTPWGWIVEAYRLADSGALDGGSGPLVPNGSDPDPFHDVVLTIAPDRVEDIQREIETARRFEVSDTRPPITRRINQNSEFLGGYILANFIFPESNGTRDANTESWSDEDLTVARAGGAAAMLNWQKFTQMDINYVLSYYDRIPTGYEPIAHDMNTDERWIADTMRSMGWGTFSDNAQGIVHEFNESERAYWRTQWAVTSFIATSRNTPGNRFKSGTANYTAYAFLGGPYMVEPFPAGSDPNEIGEDLVYSQIVNHEVGHLFWTLDEYPGSPGVCATRSGYLDHDNANVTMTDPGGGQARCIPHIPCIMHTAARLNQNRPWCEYSKMHLGVGDDNLNGLPDIFEAEPEITFSPAAPETLTTNTYTLRFKVKARAVPNRNPFQDPDQRVSYALPLDGAKLLLGSLTIDLDALDGRWDELEEDCEFTVGLSQVGQVAFIVQAYNEIKFKSAPATKTVYFAGVRYNRLVAVPKRDVVIVSWETIGETFGARFDLYRLEQGQSMPGTLIAQNVRPYDTGYSGQPMYRVFDTDVKSGSDYRYYIEGVFDLPYEGGTREYRSQSKVVAQTAMLELVDIVSNVAPNPTRGSVTFSVAVPPTFEESTFGQLPIPTNVDIRVYNVRGQLVRTLKTTSELNPVITLRWDGTYQDGTPAPSGIYFLRVISGEEEGVRKIVMLR
ncbi:MAG: T9SS type A sorting domain-containing protein [Candidatus Latescibacteria bacterium]|nr:T9SS type A sorting domain-containing protein [Candidatus Latescibacterota bacterium]